MSGDSFAIFNAIRLALKAIDASGLTTAERDGIGANINRNSFFSAGVNNENLLEEMRGYIVEAVEGERGFHRDDFLKKMREVLNITDKDAPFTGVKKIESDQRLYLIYDTQTAMAQGEADYELFNNPDLAELFPAQELLRVEWRKDPRDWRKIWREAGGQFYNGRMIAKRNDPIWTRISDFGNPYPPFKYNSGMGVEDIPFLEAVELGVIDEDYVAPANTPLARGDELQFGI